MPAVLSMRHLRCSRLLRVMALFAWMMLVAVSVPAAAIGTATSTMHHAMPATMGSMMWHGMQHTAKAGDHHDGCCGNASQPACQCDAMCGSMLLPALTALPGAGIHVARYAMLRGIDAPTITPIPPLRPPAA